MFTSDNSLFDILMISFWLKRRSIVRAFEIEHPKFTIALRIEFWGYTNKVPSGSPVPRARETPSGSPVPRARETRLQHWSHRLQHWSHRLQHWSHRLQHWSHRLRGLYTKST
ncbi:MULTISPECIES: hypothetical protein [Nostocales]|uniref:Uncharacterized protein n=1 Tax=Scytonema tolypothrichoides VB-61278_2 TaxID=3232314 RepID=A0ABW8WP92_9CYAN|nr:hypothetical protein [Tolypothrix bouteillei]